MTPDQFRKMTPAEFHAIAKGRIAWYTRVRGDRDIMNGFLCAVIQASAGVEDTKPERYMVFKERRAIEPKSEKELEQKLMRLGGPND